MTTKTTFLLASARAALATAKRTRKDEDGAMIIFSLFMFVLILWLGGMAVDLMRFETTRAKLQGTLDRATLAAADLDQVLPPADVVRDYFNKAGMADFLDGEPIVDEGLNYRVVTANARADMPLFFYDIPRVFTQPFNPGLTTLTVSGSSTAEERVTDVEVSLVLDVSGSMNSNNRITNLRPAARDFVSTVLANNTNAPQGLITISMIPYSAVVNPGTDIIPHLNINRAHTYSTCPLFDTDMFSSTTLNLSDSYDHVAHFDPDWYWDSDDYEPIKYPWCHLGDHNSIVPLTTDENALHTAINALEPYGNTAIDMGMKWGVGLLDPSTRTLVSALAGASGTGVPAIADGRPYDHTQPDVLKVIVLMTDGQNTQQYDLKDQFKYGLSPIWFNRENSTQMLHDVPSNRISIQYGGESTPTYRWDDWFYWTGYGSSSRAQRYPNGFSGQWEYANAVGVTDPDYASEDLSTFDADAVHLNYYSNDVVNASWQDLYAEHVYNRVNNEYLSKPYNHGYINWSNGTYGETDYSDPDYAINYSVVNNTQADSRLSSLCAAARNQGIVVYTVAFEAPSGGQTALQDCASSPSHYFDVNGTDITEAFQAIASDIRALKLTQ